MEKIQTIVIGGGQAGYLKESLARSDKAEADITELDLKGAGVNTILWAIGYDFDYSLIKLPVTDEDGYPLQQRGVTAYPGLYFVGLSWLHKRKSPLLM